MYEWLMYANDALRSYPLVTGSLAGATIFIACYWVVRAKAYTEGWRAAEMVLLSELWSLANDIGKKNMELMGARDLFPQAVGARKHGYPLIEAAKRDWSELSEWIDLYRKGVEADRSEVTSGKISWNIAQYQKD